MASIQRISSRGMRTDAEEFSTVLKDIPQIMEQLQTSMTNLARCWEGPAWSSFQAQVNSDIQNMHETYQTLVQLQQHLAEGRETYLRAEYDVYTDMKSLWI